MAISFASPVTGASVSGLTSPTFTLVSDYYPDGQNGKQSYVSSLGGTQPGATAHSVSSPFTIAATRPKVLKQRAALNGQGQLVNNGKNTYGIITRKGATPAADQTDQIILIRTEVSVPAGVDAYDAAELASALSCHIGFLSSNSSGLFDTCKSGGL